MPKTILKQDGTAFAVTDCHMHTLEHAPQLLPEIAQHFGFSKYCALGCPAFAGDQNNGEALAAKRADPAHVYAFGGMVYGEGQRTPAAHRAQVQALIDGGFDGLKIVESKPNYAKALSLAMDSEELDAAFALCEETGFPILWHVGDPATFWDAKLAPKFAVDHGWCYLDDSFFTLPQLFEQVENVLKKHPRLRVCFAHFYFVSDDMAHARHMLDTYPGVRFDLTPGSEMFGNFLKGSAAWRAFFVEYQDRLLFGTDFYDQAGEMPLFEEIYNLSVGTLTTHGAFAQWDMAGEGLALPDAVLERIFEKNFDAFAGATPRAIPTLQEEMK